MRESGDDSTAVVIGVLGSYQKYHCEPRITVEKTTCATGGKASCKVSSPDSLFAGRAIGIPEWMEVGRELCPWIGVELRLS